MLKDSFDLPYKGKDVGYVLVIARAVPEGKVVVVRKTKPAWQAGRFNFPGGKIEAGETPLRAAVRELNEETGIVLHPDQLRPVAVVSRDGAFEMYVFAGESPAVLIAETLTEEEVLLLSIDDIRLITPDRGIENLAWLYGMAFDGFAKCARIEYE